VGRATFGIGINFDEICDLHTGATIAEPRSTMSGDPAWAP